MSGGAKVGKPTIQTILAAVLTDEAGIAQVSKATPDITVAVENKRYLD